MQKQFKPNSPSFHHRLKKTGACFLKASDGFKLVSVIVSAMPTQLQFMELLILDTGKMYETVISKPSFKDIYTMFYLKLVILDAYLNLVRNIIN